MMAHGLRQVQVVSAGTPTAHAITMTKTALKVFPGGVTTVSMIPDEIPGLFRVTVIHRFDSGNFVTDNDAKHLSQVAAEGLIKFYAD